MDPLLMSHCADNHSADSSVKFCLSLWDVIASSTDRVNYWADLRKKGWVKADVENSWKMYGKTVGKRFMTRPNYLTVESKPVLFHGYAHSLDFYGAEFGVTPSDVISLIRDGVRESTGLEIYFVATSTNPDSYPMLKLWGFDAFTEYLIYSNNWDGIISIYPQWWDRGVTIAKTYNLHYWVPATVGYDSTAWGSPVTQRFVPSPAQFTAHLKQARTFANNNFKYTLGQVITYAWNEFGEGGILEPMADGQLHSGKEMLLAHKAAVG